MKNIIFALIILSSLSACQKSLKETTKADSKWVLSEWPGKIIPTKAQATLNITEGNKIGGKAFCNVYGGAAVFNGNALKFSQLFSTKMYCEELAKAEDQFMTDLESVNIGKLSGGKLYLLKDEQTIMVFSKAE